MFQKMTQFAMLKRYSTSLPRKIKALINEGLTDLRSFIKLIYFFFGGGIFVVFKLALKEHEIYFDREFEGFLNFKINILIKNTV